MSKPEEGAKPAGDAHHSDAWAPAKKLAAVAAGFLAIAFAFSVGAGFMNEAVTNIDRVFIGIVKISLALVFASIVWTVLSDKH